MNLHEYQARGLLRDAGVPVPDGDVAATPEEVEAIAKRLGTGVVVKAQVHAGGRGKAGGVKLAKDAAEARTHAEAILGMEIKGLTVEKVLVVPTVDIATESYVGVIVDRASERAVMMVSPAGGVDIEEVAASTPEKIFKQSIDPHMGLLPHQAIGCFRSTIQFWNCAPWHRSAFGATARACWPIFSAKVLIHTATPPRFCWACRWSSSNNCRRQSRSSIGSGRRR